MRLPHNAVNVLGTWDKAIVTHETGEVYRGDEDAIQNIEAGLDEVGRLWHR